VYQQDIVDPRIYSYTKKADGTEAKGKASGQQEGTGAGGLGPHPR
jgi:hypothetical protein